MYPDQFDDLFCNLTEAGEQSGTLETLLGEIAEYKEKSESLKKKIKKALFYPIAVLGRGLHRHLPSCLCSSCRSSSLYSRAWVATLPAFTRMIVDRLRVHASLLVHR